MLKTTVAIGILGLLLVSGLIAATIVPVAGASDDDLGGTIMTFPGFTAGPESIFGKDAALDFQLELNGTLATVSSATTVTDNDVFDIFGEPFSFSAGTVTGIQLSATP